MIAGHLISLCSKGQLENAKQCYEDNSHIISNLRLEDCFQIACDHSRIEIAKWIYSIHPNLDVHIWSDHAFYRACECKNIELAKWLISLTKSHTIANYYEYCTTACANGHLELIKDIVTHIPNFNVSYKNHELFRCAMNNRYINGNESVKYGYIIEWIHTMKPWVYKIKYFREELSHYDDDYDGWEGFCYPELDTIQERNWYMRKYFVYAASNSAPNKKTLLYNLPVDLSRLVISYI
jgi:hypothetical protein